MVSFEVVINSKIYRDTQCDPPKYVAGSYFSRKPTQNCQTRLYIDVNYDYQKYMYMKFLFQRVCVICMYFNLNISDAAADAFVTGIGLSSQRVGALPFGIPLLFSFKNETFSFLFRTHTERPKMVRMTRFKRIHSHFVVFLSYDNKCAD